MILERVYVWVLFSFFTYLNTENERMKITIKKIYIFSKKKHFFKYSQTEAMAWGCSGSCSSQASTYSFIKKETLVQVFSCEFYKISQNNFSYMSYRTLTGKAYVSNS